ncbi:hypothetical protein [Amycolatopsis sp. NPDC051903]|uniref:hypothetical protein n=1 Tax=Amycolatopsis sp. NPDC051903 TaxID=3363936 RepID=UPI0037B044BA
MSGPFVFIATNRVREGKLEAEKNRVPGWVRFIDEREPRVLGFHEYLSEDGTEVEYVQIHPDAASFEHHLAVLAAEANESYRETLEATTAIRVYGEPTQPILDLLHAFAGEGVPITVFPQHLGGFQRA